MDWRPRCNAEHARLRARMLARARDYFDSTGVMEVDVPALSRATVSDPNIDCVPVRLAIDDGTPYFLHTSPEYAMKRLLAADYPDIYFLGKVFRDGESGRRHQPEFTMAEWYRRGYGLDKIIEDTARFICHVLDALPLQPTPDRLTYRDAFEASLGIDPLAATAADLAGVAHADQHLRAALLDDRDAWLDLIMATRVAPTFSADRLTIISHYPASQAALARLVPDGSVAERFEVFVGEVELANGYVELTDADEQRRRFAVDREHRVARGQGVGTVDEALLAALDAGLPECAGVAVGFDRLLMLNAGRDDLRDVLTFPFEPKP